MIFLFIGMVASGISARVTLLSHRGGWFLVDQARKTPSMVIFDLIGTISGIAAFVISFLLFQWWIPLVALALGYWVIAPIIVTASSYAFFHQTQILTSLVALTCSSLICAMYFNIL